MRFTDPMLVAAINDATTSTEPETRAMGHNLKWEERLSDDRIAGFQQSPFLPSAPYYASFVRGYTTYKNERLEWNPTTDPVPEPFQAMNGAANLAALPDERRMLVRMVQVRDDTLAGSGLTFDQLDSAIRLVRRAAPDDDTVPVREARAALQGFASVWNAFNRRMPSFCGFATDVDMELTGTDWGHGLRDRFGMGHFHVPPGGRPIMILLLQYTVGDILRAAQIYGARDRAICLPTVLESNLYAYYYPSPTPLPFGRTVYLGGGIDDSRLTCELIHLPVDINADQIQRLGRITDPIPDKSLAEVRNDHLFLVRYETMRNDFGEDM